MWEASCCTHTSRSSPSSDIFFSPALFVLLWRSFCGLVIILFTTCTIVPPGYLAYFLYVRVLLEVIQKGGKEEKLSVLIICSLFYLKDRMRQSYTVTVTAERSVSLSPFMKAHELRRKSSAMSGSMLVSTFVGLLINHVKVWVCAGEDLWFNSDLKY